jgi:hypothetical protein
VSKPAPSVPPRPADTTSADSTPSGEPAADLEADTPAEVPLNRAERRAKAAGKSDPSHVGPRSGPAYGGRGARSHTKRRSG